ncbi:hypothetical protein AB3S75_012174 [Citrus x aurantiifolia]
MAGQIRFHLLLFVFVCSIFIHLMLVTAAQAKRENSDGVPLIGKSCNVTEFAKECISVFESDPRSRAAANLTSLVGVGMNISYEKIKVAKSYFLKAQKNATDHWTKEYIDDCLVNYDAAIWQMDNHGFPSFDKRNYEDAISAVNVCNYAAGFCAENGVQLYVQENKKLFNFTGAVYEILSTLINPSSVLN